MKWDECHFVGACFTLLVITPGGIVLYLCHLLYEPFLQSCYLFSCLHDRATSRSGAEIGLLSFWLDISRGATLGNFLLHLSRHYHVKSITETSLSHSINKSFEFDNLKLTRENSAVEMPPFTPMIWNLQPDILRNTEK